MDIVRLASERAKALEQRLETLLGESRVAEAPRLLEAMRYSSLGGGKRLRPLLCILACEAVGGTAEIDGRRKDR